MKKKAMIFLGLLFLVGCQSFPVHDVQKVDEFEFNQQCPYVCWLGISPGITTTEDALSIILSSNQVDEDTFLELDEKTIYFIWSTQNHHSSVTVGFENGLVAGIVFQKPLYYEVNDLLNLLGEPDEISVQLQEEVETNYYIYILFFPLTRTVVVASSANPEGPNPDDAVDHLSLNTGIDEFMLNNATIGNVQPWLGYGHLQDYLPGVDIQSLLNPTGP